LIWVRRVDFAEARSLQAGLQMR